MKKEYKTNCLVKYNLKTGKDTKEALQIFLIMSFKGKRLRTYTGKRIEEKNWNKHKQRAKPQYSNATTLNIYLDKLANFVEDEFNKYLIEGKEINLSDLKTAISERQNKFESIDIFETYDEFLKESKNVRTTGTIKNYETTLSRLKAYNQQTKDKINYQNIDSKFHLAYRDFLITKKKLSNNTIAKDIKNLKTFLNWSTDKGYNKNIAYLKFKNAQNEGNIIFLTWDELTMILEFDLSNNSRLKKVRDVFCFGCFTGMRFSDIMNLRHENIDDEYIHVTTIKTGTNTYIPFNQYSRKIYDEYKSKKGKVFDEITNQKMNEYLKELGKLVKLETPVVKIKFNGTNRTEEVIPKHDLLTSHIARKTFITNALQKGMSTEVIMDITTHKDHRVFKRYYEVVNDHKKNEMNKIFG